MNLPAPIQRLAEKASRVEQALEQAYTCGIPIPEEYDVDALFYDADILDRFCGDIRRKALGYRGRGRQQGSSSEGYVSLSAGCEALATRVGPHAKPRLRADLLLAEAIFILLSTRGQCAVKLHAPTPCNSDNPLPPQSSSVRPRGRPRSVTENNKRLIRPLADRWRWYVGGEPRAGDGRATQKPSFVQFVAEVLKLDGRDINTRTLSRHVAEALR